MSSHTAQIESVSKKVNLTQQILSVVVTIVTATAVVYAFISNLTNTMEIHTQELKELKSDVDAMKNNMQTTEIYKGVSSTEIKALEDKVNSIESKMDRMDEKLDKILIRK